MLMSLRELIGKHGMNVTGVIHVGAHTGEEAQQYQENGITNVWWIEGNPDLIPELAENFAPYNHKVIEALVYEEDDVELDFNITNLNGLSSSILEFGTHRVVSPDVKFVDKKRLLSVRLDTLVGKYSIIGCNFLSMDLQGAELHCLKGASKLLSSIDYVFTEVNVDELYLGCVRLPELDKFLEDFQRVETHMAGAAGWGDALYIRKSAR